MSLRQTKQLIVQIEELLEHGKNAAQAAQMANDYNELCLEVAHRLSQCITLLENGNIAGCIQLAGVSPPLTELVALLKFASLERWKAHCQQSNLPFPTPFDDTAINGLITALQQEDTIGPDHPLSREFSRHMMARDMEAAYAVLKVILEKDPSNQSANNIKPEIEESILKLRGAKLQEVVNRNDLEGANNTIENIEALPFADASQISCWPAAKNLQCYLWANKINAAYGERDWQFCLEQLDKVDVAKKDFSSIQLPAQTEQVLQQIRTWASGMESEWMLEANYDDSLQQVNMFLSTQKSERASGVRRKREEIVALQEELALLWDNLKALGKTIPQEVQEAFRAESEALTTEATRRRRGKRLLVTTCVMIALSLATFVTISLVSKDSAVKLLANLEDYKKDRQVGLMEAGIKGLKLKSLKGILVPGFSGKLSEFEQYIEEELETKNNTDALVEKLESLQQFTSIDVSDHIAVKKTAEQFTVATGKIPTLAPEFRKPMEDRIAVCKDKWQSRFKGRKSALLTAYEDLLEKMEKVKNTTLKPGQGLKPAQDGLAELEKFNSEWNKVTNGVPGLLAPSSSHLQRQSQLSAAIEKAKADISAMQVLLKSTKSAVDSGNLAGYFSSLSRYPHDNLITSREKSAASAITSLMITERGVQALLFHPGPKISLTFLDALVKPVSFVRQIPLKAGDASTIRFVKLMTEDQINKCEVRYIYSPTSEGGIAKEEIVYFHPVNKLPPNLPFGWNQKYRYILHRGGTGRWRDSEISNRMDGFIWRNDDEFSKKISTQLSHQRAITGCGIDQMADVNAGKWNDSALDVLGNIYRFGAGNCIRNIQELQGYNEVFLGYLAWQMFKLIELDPLGWGYSWSITAQSDRKYFEEQIGVDKIITTPAPNWMRFSGREKFLDPKTNISKLTQFFIFANSRSYTYKEEALAFHKLLQRAYKNGNNVKFIGHLDIDGKPTPTLAGAQGEIILGINKDSKIAVIYKYDPGKNSFTKVGTPLPLTPLFKVSGARLEMLSGYQAKFGTIPGNFLPLYFRLK